jgi:hypothetical protein
MGPIIDIAFGHMPMLRAVVPKAGIYKNNDFIFLNSDIWFPEQGSDIPAKAKAPPP